MQLADCLALQGVEVEDLVVDGDHLATLGEEVTTAHDALWRARGGAVEEGGLRRPPVHEERLFTLAGDPDPADVQPCTVGEIEPAEAKRQVTDRHRLQAALQQAGEGVALGPPLVRPGGRGEADVGELGLQLGPVAVELLVEHRDVGTLAGKLAGGVALAWKLCQVVGHAVRVPAAHLEPPTAGRHLVMLAELEISSAEVRASMPPSLHPYDTIARRGRQVPSHTARNGVQRR